MGNAAIQRVLQQHHRQLSLLQHHLSNPNAVGIQVLPSVGAHHQAATSGDIVAASIPTRPARLSTKLMDQPRQHIHGCYWHLNRTCNNHHPRVSPARMHRRSKPRREPEQRPLSWNGNPLAEPDGRPQYRRGRGADSWFRGQHQPLAFQPTGAGQTGARLCHRSTRLRP